MTHSEHSEKFEDMEHHAPPAPPAPAPDDPSPASAEDIIELLAQLPVAKSIAGAAALFRKRCEGGDTYENNCAHFLSDAFLRAGYTDLQANSNCIEARCGTSAKRPIRARNMKCWFESIATETRSGLPKNDGFWAVFQLDESAYWGGHVIIYDSDKNVYYGTEHYPNWAQHCFKW